MNPFSKTEQALIEYFNTGAVLIEQLNQCVKKNKALDDKAVIALNDFIIAAHQIVDLQLALESRRMKLN